MSTKQVLAAGLRCQTELRDLPPGVFKVRRRSKRRATTVIVKTLKTPLKPRLVAAPNRDGVRRAFRDRQLIDRCLGGDKAAWTELYQQFHPPLILAIHVLLGRDARRHDLVDDIAAKIWFMAIDNSGALLAQFDVERGCRLSTFLASIARNEIASHFRSERRRINREAHAFQHRAKVASDSHLQSPFGIGIALREFLSTLSPRESEFCKSHLLAVPEEGDSAYSPANRWQLQRRVRLKLWEFLERST